MGCLRVQTKEFEGFICSRGPLPREKCVICGKPHQVLCDYPVSPAKTCDAALCRRCAVHVPGMDIDYCPGHQMK